MASSPPAAPVRYLAPLVGGLHSKPLLWRGLIAVLISTMAVTVVASTDVLAHSGNRTPASASSSYPTMTFRTSVNPLGLLDGIAVFPATVHVDAGGAVEFANASALPLTFSIANHVVTVPAGHLTAFRFPGAVHPQRLNATATAVEIPDHLPSLRELFTSSGTIIVAAQPSTTPTPSGQRQPRTDSTSGASPTGPDVPDRDGGTVEASAAADSAAIESDPSAGDGGTAVLIPPSELGAPADRSGNAGQINDWGVVAGTGGPTDEYRQRSAISEETGLLIVLATILLIGVGFATIRAVMVRRTREPITQ